MKKDFYRNFNKSAFLRGVARSIDIGCTKTNYQTLNNSDYNAIKSDWQIVGNDINITFKKMISNNE